MIPHVLLIDGSPSVRANLQHALTGAGFTVTACENGALARRALRTGAYALIILDVLLPDANGIEIAQEVRAYPPTAKAPIMVLSAESDLQQRIRGLTAGATEYIGKPYGVSYVIKRARQLTDMRGASGVGGNNGSPGPLRILLVDDSPTFLNAFADRLRTEGHDVVLAKSGSEALSFLAVQPVDGVVLDVFMPGISGLETCRRIRSTAAWADIPVMMLTGREDSVAKATGLTAGVDDYVVKSTDVTSMAARLGEMLRKRRLERGAAKVTSSKGPESPRDPARIGPIIEKAVVTRGPDSARDTPRIGLSTARGPDSARDAPRAAALSERPPSSRTPDSPRDWSRDPTRESTRPPPPDSPPSTRRPDSVRDSGRTSPVFEQVLAVCGLPQFIARSSLKRAFDRAGVDADSLSPESLDRALAEVRQTLGLFLPASEMERHVAAIVALARRHS